MKQALVTLVRGHWLSIADGSLLSAAVNDPRLARVVAAIIEQPGAGHTVGSLALLAGMSRASFCDHFSRTFGRWIEFVQKIVNFRVAARLLDVTDLPILAIAQSIGYAGSRSFAKAFEATYGSPPYRYRERSNFDDDAAGYPIVQDNGSAIQSFDGGGTPPPATRHDHGSSRARASVH
ncbi:helix-turn-helix domain-containing protein [Sphingomonas sp. MMS24-JH45]